MRLELLAQSIGAAVRCRGNGGSVELDRVYAGDRVSDLLNAAGDHTLLVSNLGSAQLLQLAGLMDVPALCLVQGQEPDAAMLQVAEAHGTLLMVSPRGLFETCGRIHATLRPEGPHEP